MWLEGSLHGWPCEWDRWLFVTSVSFFFFQAEDGIRDLTVTGVQTCALPISSAVEERKLHELVVVCGESDPREQHLVGDVEREPRQDRSAVRFGGRAEPSSCRSEERRVGEEGRSRGSAYH